MEAYKVWTNDIDLYHVGLNIAKDNSGRVFGNGVPWNEEKHGSYYKDVSDPVDADECKLD